jgi:hypothetical protein
LIGAPSTGFFKKTVSIIYDKELMWLVDIEYYARLLKLYKVSYVSDPLVTTVISDIQLTTQLKNNRNVEVREFLHCYCKLIGSMNRLNKKIMRSRLIYVLYHFDIRSQADIQSTGFDASIPVYANVVLFCMAIHRRLAYRVFCRLNYLNLEKLW